VNPERHPLAVLLQRLGDDRAQQLAADAAAATSWDYRHAGEMAQAWDDGTSSIVSAAEQAQHGADDLVAVYGEIEMYSIARGPEAGCSACCSKRLVGFAARQTAIAASISSGLAWRKINGGTTLCDRPNRLPGAYASPAARR
jgi:hypothetical protein